MDGAQAEKAVFGGADAGTVIKIPLVMIPHMTSDSLFETKIIKEPDEHTQSQ